MEHNYTTQNDNIWSFFPYNKDPIHEPLYIQQLGDITGIIMNLGTHPCSYIIFPAKRYAIYSSIVNNDCLPVHGGITYHGTKLNLGDGREISGYIIGWDYQHFGDYDIFTGEGLKITKFHLISDLVNAAFYIQEMEEEFDVK